MKKYFKVINTNTKEEKFFKARRIHTVLAHLAKYMTSDWVYGVNIVEVNEDGSLKENGDFLMEAVRDYWAEELETESDEKIMRCIYEWALLALKCTAE